MLVYLAGPYTKPDPAVNTRNAILLGAEIRDRFGVTVYVPHFSHFEHLLRPQPWERWLQIDLQWVERATVLYRMPGESAGADIEVAAAKAKGIPVVGSIEALADWLLSRK